MKQSDYRKKNSISHKLWTLSLSLLIPMLLVSLFIFGLLSAQKLRYEKVIANIATVSGFNQNFKDIVDLKMYNYICLSERLLPVTELAEAKSMAETLLDNTTDSDGRRDIVITKNLVDNLSNCIEEIVDTEGYDQRMAKLENNVYIITSLIQRYMYTYLYHEAGELARLRDASARWLQIQTFLIMVIILLIVLLLFRKIVRTSRSITQPIDALYRRVQAIGSGDLTIREPVPAEDDKLQALSDSLEEMVGRLNEQIELNRREQDRLRGMELSLLQAQINPHFLYNTLDAIVWLVEAGKNDQAVEMVSSLSTYFRTALSNGKEIIPLREELLHVKSYLEIQQVRYKDILRYSIDVGPELESCRIPKMTLQPLVENAIYHGIKPRRGVGTIRISGSLEGGDAVLEVADDGAGMAPETLERIRASLAQEDAPGFGIFAVCQRLRLTFGSGAGLDIESTQNVGTTVRIRFPYSASEEESQ